MTLTGSSASPFAAIEAAIYKALFAGYSPYAAITRQDSEGRAECSAEGSVSSAAKGSSKNGAARAPGPGTSGDGGQTLRAKEESETLEPESCKKTD